MSTSCGDHLFGEVSGLFGISKSWAGRADYRRSVDIRNDDIDFGVLRERHRIK